MRLEPGGDFFKVGFLVIDMNHKVSSLFARRFKLVSVKSSETLCYKPGSSFVTVSKWVV